MLEKIIDFVETRMRYECAMVVADLGNAKLKIYRNPQPRNVAGLYTSPVRKEDHYVYRVTEVQWFEEYSKLYDARHHFHFIECQGEYFIIGRQMPLGGDIRRTGDTKFEEEYIKPLTAYALMTTFDGRPPDTIVYAIGHPPMTQAESERIEKTLKGKLRFGVPSGKKVERISVNIVATYAFTEIIGSVNKVALMIDDKDNQIKKHPIKGKGPTLALDLGGGSFDLVGLDVQGRPTTMVESELIGINDTIRNFNQLWKACDDPKAMALRKNARMRDKLPENIITDCFQHPDKILKIGVHEYDAKEIYDQAVRELMMSLNNSLDRMLGNSGFAQYQQALVTGGGGDIMFNEIRENILGFFGIPDNKGNIDYRHIHLAGVPGVVIYSNVEGAADTFLAVEALLKKKQKLRVER